MSKKCEKIIFCKYDDEMESNKLNWNWNIWTAKAARYIFQLSTTILLGLFKPWILITIKKMQVCVNYWYMNIPN